jgi:ribosomal protein S12 methylthiotransferase accessory factor
MEAIEAYHAEFTSISTRIDTYTALRRELPVVEPQSLPLARNSLYHPDAALPWVEGYDLLADGPLWIPFELVHANATVPRLPGGGCFLLTTNGLASGNTLAEAVLHGLCEVVERDALAGWGHGPEDRLVRTRVRIDTIDDPTCCALLRRFEAAGVAVLIWDITSKIGIPAFYATIFDRSADPLLRPLPALSGAGCHPDRAIALIRALTEAAQSRLTGIAGSRDDLDRERYLPLYAAETLDFFQRLETTGTAERDFRSTPSLAEPTIEADVHTVLERLRGVGLDHAVIVDLSRPEVPVAVVRVIVPGLEGPIQSSSYQPGPRMTATVS